MNEKKKILVGIWMGCDFGRDALSGIRSAIIDKRLPWAIRFVNRTELFAAATRWMVRAGHINGAISCFEDTLSGVAALRRARVPVVWLSRERPTAAQKRSLFQTAHVALDTAAVVRESVKHFRERTGFRSFGFVDSFWSEGWSQLRGDLCLRELSRLGLKGHRFNSGLRSSRRCRDSGPDSTRLISWLRSLEKPAAVLAANDATACDIVEICISAGIDVPRSVAVLGMDDDPAYCMNTVPNISSVRFDGRQAGALCVEALASMVEGGEHGGETLTYGVSSVVQRASTGAVSTAGALVQKALDFIVANAKNDISLDDVVRHTGASRALVTLRFRELRGETVMHAIKVRRLAVAAKLLSETRRSIEDVAASSGFGSIGAFRRCVREQTGLSPVEWRRQLGKGS